MRFSHFFIDRPIFATVLSVFITLVGAVAYVALPVAQYPNVVPPTVQVITGAGLPEAAAVKLALPIADSVWSAGCVVICGSTPGVSGVTLSVASAESMQVCVAPLPLLWLLLQRAFFGIFVVVRRRRCGWRHRRSDRMSVHVC
mgnify:CR=1 FL=1